MPVTAATYNAALLLLLALPGVATPFFAPWKLSPCIATNHQLCVCPGALGDADDSAVLLEIINGWSFEVRLYFLLPTGTHGTVHC